MRRSASSGIVPSTGPFSVPVFAAYGLVGGAFLSTEAASSMTLSIAKVVTFRSLGALPAATFVKGLLVGTSLMASTGGGKRIVQRLSVHLFRRLLDAVICARGCR